MFQYILFDLDGTLTNPKIGITKCVQYALMSLGIEEQNLDKLEPFIGPPLTDSFEQFYGLSKEQTDLGVKKYRERFSAVGLYENEMYPGIDTMLRVLSERGIQLAVASSKPEIFVEKILEHFKIREYFSVVVGSELDGRRVQKEEVVKEALRRLGISASKKANPACAMVGDRKFDVEGAQAMRLVSVAVTYGFAQGDELVLAKRDYIVQTVDELQRILLQ